MSADIPLFANTEGAMRYGRDLRRVIGRDEFQTLVRTWMVAQIAFDNAGDSSLQARQNLAYRVQTLREAVRGFLFDDQDPRHKAAIESHQNLLHDAPVEVLQGAS